MTQRYDSLAVTFPDYTDLVSPQNIANGQRNQLCDAQAGRIEHLKNCSITDLEGIVAIDRVENAVHGPLWQGRWKSLGEFGPGYLLGWVERQLSAPRDVTEK
jgi:hypothetical protein